MLDSSLKIFRDAVRDFSPDYVVSMVSGGRDSACSHAVASELGIKIDLVIHGRTGCGIPETTDFVRQNYGAQGNYAEADAGTAYEDYVLRKGFFGAGVAAHAFAYRILKATPFRKVVSAELRKRRRGVKVMLLNGARKNESVNREKHLKIFRRDPAAPGNIWVNLIHEWSAQNRDKYLASRSVLVNPVAVQLCRSGECMCGTMQSRGDRQEAAALYPRWGAWLAKLESEVRSIHGFGWGEQAASFVPDQIDMFQPMCSGCTREAT